MNELPETEVGFLLSENSGDIYAVLGTKTHTS